MNFKATADLETVKQYAELLEDDNRRLARQVAKLSAEVSELKGETPEQLQLRIAELERQLGAMKKDKYGSKSERRRRKRRSNKPATTRKAETPKGSPAEKQAELYTLDDDAPERVCPGCGEVMPERPGLEEKSTLIDVIERRYVLREVTRAKYRCACCTEHFVTAPAPQADDDRLVAGGSYSVDFGVAVAVDKYLNHQALERQSRDMRRRGLEVTSSTLFTLLWQMAGYAAATYEELPARIKSQDVIYVDESTWPMLAGGKRKRRHIVWAMANELGAFHKLLPGQSAEAAREVVGAYDGWLMCDGASWYNAAAAQAGYRTVECWAHVRRKFVEREVDHPEATEVLDLIDAMFRVEREIEDAFKLECAAAEADEREPQPFFEVRRQMREEHTRPLLTQIADWLMRHKSLPRTGLGPAVTYAVKRWDRLKLIVDVPELPLTNNFVERRLRQVVMGRRNHQGSRSRRGQLVMATMYSLVETAVLNGVDPARYLKAIVVANKDLPRDGPGAVVWPEDVDAILGPPG